MASNTFDSACAERQIQASNMSIATVLDCMGDSDADQEHALLKVNSPRTLPLSTADSGLQRLEITLCVAG